MVHCGRRASKHVKRGIGSFFDFFFLFLLELLEILAVIVVLAVIVEGGGEGSVVLVLELEELEELEDFGGEVDSASSLSNQIRFNVNKQNIERFKEHIP